MKAPAWWRRLFRGPAEPPFVIVNVEQPDGTIVIVDGEAAPSWMVERGGDFGARCGVWVDDALCRLFRNHDGGHWPGADPEFDGPENA